jgi:hypothetical protein
VLPSLVGESDGGAFAASVGLLVLVWVVVVSASPSRLAVADVDELTVLLDGGVR